MVLGAIASTICCSIATRANFSPDHRCQGLPYWRGALHAKATTRVRCTGVNVRRLPARGASRRLSVLCHRCRYSREMLAEELRGTGFEIERFQDFNHFAIPGWFLNGKILKRRSFSRFQLKVFTMLVPLVRRLDPVVPGRGLGIIAVARRV